MSTKTTITEAEVKKVASLSRLRLNAEEIAYHTTNLNNIFDLIAAINTQDTEGVAPMASPFANSLSLRDDKVTEIDQRALLLQLAPSTESGLFLVPQVIE